VFDGTEDLNHLLRYWLDNQNMVRERDSSRVSSGQYLSSEKEKQPLAK
jgi:hypothetical protein